MTQFRPMLAGQADLAKIRYPLMTSFKLDGVRALVKDGKVLSRTLKPIPNLQIQASLGAPEYEGYDGELIAGNPTDPDVYRNTVSQVMTIDASLEGMRWLVFDKHDRPENSFWERYHSISSMRLEHSTVGDEKELLAFETEALRLGYEGIILRDPCQLYKYGRSTRKEQGMLKLKRFADSEGKVIDFEELQHNANPAEKNELGYTKHSHHQAGKIGTDTLGALVVVWQDGVLRIGTGFSQMEREHIWQHRNDYIHQWAKFKYLPIGMKDLPRHPVFLGFRNEIDVGG